MLAEHEDRSPQVDPDARGRRRAGRGARAVEAAARCARLFGRHRDDRVIG